MSSINTLTNLMSHFEKSYSSNSTPAAGVLNGRKVSKVPDSELLIKLKEFTYQGKTGHEAFVAELSSPHTSKFVKTRGIEIIKNAHYTGCPEAEKPLLIQQLSDSVASITCDEVLHPPAPKRKPEHMEWESSPSASELPRQQFGGKGMFLKTMQEMELPVPPFQPINIAHIKSFESETFKTALIKPFIPEFPDQSSGTSLQEIANRIKEFRPFEK